MNVCMYVANVLIKCFEKLAHSVEEFVTNRRVRNSRSLNNDYTGVRRLCVHMDARIHDIESIKACYKCASEAMKERYKVIVKQQSKQLKSIDSVLLHSMK